MTVSFIYDIGQQESTLDYKRASRTVVCQDGSVLVLNSNSTQLFRRAFYVTDAIPR